ncbi:helix-turn-helix domain-containing protein [Rhodobacterales bacterium HKCCE2091]|nr:helix-turn-helix domain-containing protein [Rhodobacterales bacterium HKCCE2091]
MAGSHDAGTIITFAVVPFPGFPMMAFSSVIEPLRAANTLAQRTLYRWMVVGPRPGAVVASNGIAIQPDGFAAEAPAADRIVVCSGGDAELLKADAVVRWMRRSARAGASVGAVADGAFFLARAGFLDGHACTLHWTSQPSFAERFPMIDLRRDLFVIDRKRFTSTGGVGSLDMMLHIIAEDYGRDLAAGVAEWFVHSPLRSSIDRRLMPVRLRTGVRDELVLSAIALMEDTVEERMTIPEIAAALEASPDRLERAFRAAVRMSPSAYYRRLRLRRAADLLAHSSMKVGDVALACGFQNMSSFSRAFREVHGHAPRDARRP